MGSYLGGYGLGDFPKARLPNFFVEEFQGPLLVSAEG